MSICKYANKKLFTKFNSQTKFRYVGTRFASSTRSSLIKAKDEEGVKNSNIDSNNWLDSLNAFYKQFEQSIDRPQRTKKDLLLRWMTHHKIDTIKQTLKLLNSINNNERYVEIINYISKNYDHFKPNELSNVYKIYRYLNKGSSNAKTNHLVGTLDKQVEKKIKLFDVNDLYNISVGIYAETKPKRNEFVVKISDQLEAFLNDEKCLQNDTTDYSEITNIEERVMEYDKNYNIMKKSNIIWDAKIFKMPNPMLLDTLVKRLNDNQHKMPVFYLVNCITIFSKFHKSLKKDCGPKVADQAFRLLKSHKETLFLNADQLIRNQFLFSSLIHIYTHDSRHEFNDWFERYYKIYRHKLINEYNDSIYFYENLGYLNALICRKLANFSSDVCSSEYYDDELVDAILKKYDQLITDADFFSLESIADTNRTIIELKKRKTVQIFYDLLFKTFQPPLMVGLLDHTMTTAKFDSYTNDVKLLNKLTGYQENELTQDEVYERARSVKWLLENKINSNLKTDTNNKHSKKIETHSNDLSIKDLRAKLMNGGFISYSELSGVARDLELLLKQDKSCVLDLCNLLLKRSIELCADPDVIKQPKDELIKSIELGRDILRRVTQVFGAIDLDMFLEEMTKAYNNLASLLDYKALNNGSIDMKKHLILTSVLSEYLVMSNAYSKPCLEKVFEIVSFYLIDAIADARSNGSLSGEYCEKSLLAFDLLSVFEHFDITKSNFFIENKKDFQTLIAEYYKWTVQSSKIDEKNVHLFNYVSYLIHLDCEHVKEFRKFIELVPEIEKMFVNSNQFYTKLNYILQTLCVRYPSLDFKFTSAVPFDYDLYKPAYAKTISSLTVLLKHSKNDKKLTIQPKYYTGLTSLCELKINYGNLKRGDNFYNPNMKQKFVNVILYPLDNSICYANLNEPKRPYSIYIENLKTVNYPLVVVNMDEISTKRNGNERKTLLIEKINSAINEKFNLNFKSK